MKQGGCDEHAFSTMKHTALYYFFAVSTVGIGIFLILRAGNQLPQPVHSVPTRTASPPAKPIDSSLVNSVKFSLSQNVTSPLSRLFLQLFLIIAVCGIVGWLFTRCGQPAVVGEMMAGIFLGPSLFGLLAPDAFQFVFAASSLEPLRLFSQIGVCLFLFAVGMELDVSQLRHRAQTAVVVSHSSIVLPYFLGVTLAFSFIGSWRNLGLHLQLLPCLWGSA
jgi:hypothetical protein